MRGSVRKRSKNSYEIRVFVGTDADGKKRHVQETVRGNKSEAERRLAMLLLEHGDGQVLADDPGTLAQYLEQWWAVKRPGLSPNTVRSWEPAIAKLIVPNLGGRPLHRIRTIEVDGLYSKLIEQGIGPARIGTVHTILRTAFRQAVRWELLRHSPVDHADPPTIPAKDPTPPDPGAVTELLEEARATDIELYTYVLLAATLGTRRAETVALQWGDIDLDAGTVIVRRAVAEVRGAGLLIKGTKSGKSSRIALGPGVVAELRIYRRHQAELGLALGNRIEATWWLFSALPGAELPWLPSSATRKFTALRTRTGHIDVKLMSLRHFVATQLLTSGTDVRTVAGRLRHARASTTLDRYAAWVPASDREAANIMDGVIRRSS